MNHPQSISCNGVGSVSVEPGSGSTIMAYAGICSPNIQSNSDSYFNSINIIEYINSNSSNSCQETHDFNYPIPTISQKSTSITVPPNTRIELYTDVQLEANNNFVKMLYSWEGTNIGNNAIYRSTISNEPSRIIPNDDLNTSGYNESYIPSSSKTFRLTVRAMYNINTTNNTNVDSNLLEFNYLPNTISTVYGKSVFIVNSSNGVFAPSISSINVKPNNINIVWHTTSTDQTPINATNVKIFMSNVPSEDNTNFYVYDNNTPVHKDTNSGNIDFTIPNNYTINNNTNYKFKIKFYDDNNYDKLFILESDNTYNISIPQFNIGDVNTDGTIDHTDVDDLAKYIVGDNPDIDISLADINEDGNVTGADVVYLASHFIDEINFPLP